MNICDLAAAVAPECARRKPSAPPPGEKTARTDDWRGRFVPHLRILPEHFKILPAINGWDETPERIKNGVKVPEGFVYASDNNTGMDDARGIAGVD